MRGIANGILACATLLCLRTAGCRCTLVKFPALRASVGGLGANALWELRQKATLVAARSREQALRLRGGKDSMTDLVLPTGADDAVCVHRLVRF